MIRELQRRAKAFEAEANRILARHETSKSRSIELEATYRKLGHLSLAQDELFRESLRCIEVRLFRAAHVMAWAGFMDCVTVRMAGTDQAKLRKVREKWDFDGVDELRENYPEFQLLDAARDIGLFTKTETKALQGLLSKRNECAHPSDYFPNLNEAVGFVAELLHRLEKIV